MRAHGNGAPEVCVRNLLSIVAGENPYERCKGVSVDLTDKPATLAGEVAAEVGWVVGEYEPRAEEEDIVLIVDDVLNGGFKLAAEVNVES
jgi:hypothetical protein